MRGVRPRNQKIREVRKLKGYTQSALADAADCDTKTIRNAEAGRRIDVSTLDNIAQALGLTLEDVIKNSSEPKVDVNRETVDRALRTWSAQQPEGFVDCFVDDGTLEIAGIGGNFWTGRFCGHDALTNWSKAWFSTFRTQALSSELLLASEEFACFRFCCSELIHRPTKRCFSIMFLNTCQFSDGQILHWLMFPQSGILERHAS